MSAQMSQLKELMTLGTKLVCDAVGTFNNALLQNLSPNTRYYYAVGDPVSNSLQQASNLLEICHCMEQTEGLIW